MSGYLLESGAPDRLLLEDGTGVYLLDGETGPTTIPGTQSSETDAARAGTTVVGGVVSGGQAAESDEALTGSVANTGGPVTISGGQAQESDTARAGSIPGVIGSYVDEVLADAPLAYYRMGGAGAGSLRDSSGNDVHGVAEGPDATPGLVSRDTDGAWYFNGESDVATVPVQGGSLLPVIDGLTLEAWVKPDLPDPTGEYPITHRLDDGWWFGITNQRLEVRVSVDGQGVQTITGSTDLAAGDTHHVAATYDAATGDLLVYLDGVVDGTLSVTPAPLDVDPLGHVTVGADVDGAEFYAGVLDEFAIYSTALSAARLGEHYEAGATNGLASETDEARGGVIVYRYGTTDRSNRVGGRTRSGYGIATWDPNVAPAPGGLVFGESRDVANAFSDVTMDGARPVYDVSTADRPGRRDRIVVGGKDVTYFRGIPTPLPTYQLVSPLLYGPATLRLPQVAACFERVGQGDLAWLKPGATVKVQRVSADTGEVVATDYKGVVIAFNADGADLTVEIGGEASGRAALMERQMPIFRSTKDIGNIAYHAINYLGLPFRPYLGPTTGIKLARFGGTGYLDYISQLCARAWTRSGNQWTIMPGTDGVYRMARKDTTTVDATAYLDDGRTVASLRRDIAEEPNRIYATGITPEGMRVRFGAYPGLKQGKAAPYPFHDNRDFGPGTGNTDTDTGDGISVMKGRLRVTKYLADADTPGGYDDDVVAAIKELQEDADLPKTGTMTPATWRALYDLDATGFSLKWSGIEPAAQRNYTRPWIRSASGAIMRRNPAYDRHRLKVDRNIDLGSGFTIQQMREFARAERDAGEDNWVGTITFHTGALVAGNHSPGDPLTTDDVFRARGLKPGMNIRLPHSPAGDIVVHVSAISVGEDGTVTATVDTRARDSMAVWEVIQRNRESRRDPARQWVRQHRASGLIKDAIDGFDEVGGILGDKVTIEGGQWTAFEVVAGQEGTVRQLLTNTNPNAEYCMAVFGRRIHPKRLARRIGNPLNRAGHVASITVDDGGSGYTSAPDVEISGGGGEGAAANAIISGGKVVRINVTSQGGGYTSVPSVSLSGGGGSGAFATANRSGTGADRWSDEDVRKDLDDRLLLYVAGSGEEPLGYYPRRKKGNNPITGKWEDAAGFSYHTFQQPVLYVLVYADRDTSIPAGRIMWPQLEAGA